MTNWNIKFKKKAIFETNERVKLLFYRFPLSNLTRFIVLSRFVYQLVLAAHYTKSFADIITGASFLHGGKLMLRHCQIKRCRDLHIRLLPFHQSNGHPASFRHRSIIGESGVIFHLVRPL
jgi:hypothetical protein